MFWDSLTGSQRTAINAIAKDTIAEQRKLAAQYSADYLDKMVNAGLKVNRVTPEFKAELSKRLNGPVDAQVKKLTGTTLYDFVMAEVEKAR